MASDRHEPVRLPAQDDEEDALSAASRHVANAKTTRQLHLGKKRRSSKTKMEILSEVLYGEQRMGEEEQVGDDWFGVQDDDEARRFVRLNIKRVSTRAGHKFRKKVRRGKNRGGGEEAPDTIVEEDEDREQDDEGYRVGEAEGGAPLRRQQSSSVYSFTPLPESAADSTDTLSTANVATTDSPHSSRPTSPSRSPYTPLSPRATLPTLSEHHLPDSRRSASPDSLRSPSPDQPLARTLTLDESVPPASRRDTRSSFRHASRRHHLHLKKRSKELQNLLAKRGAPGARVDSTLGENEVVAPEIAQALKDAGVVVDEEEKVATDVLWEHQRGLVVFGLPRFSSAALLQFDPAIWCDGSFRESPFTPHDYPCPPYWIWRDSEFLIDMGGDKDEEGWSYAVRFRSKYWRGEAITLRSFVRRRRWIRTRVYRPEPLLRRSIGNATSAELSDPRLNWDELLRSPSDDRSTSPVNDLKSACAALPLPQERKDDLYLTTSSSASLCSVSSRNPFVAFRQIKREAACLAREDAANDGKMHPIWRDAVREINERRVAAVMRRTRIDRERLALWEVWLGEGEKERSRTRERKEEAGKNEKGKEKKEEPDAEEGGAGEVAARDFIGGADEDKPESEDVWDLLERRLPALLVHFDYHLTRLSFLRLLLSLHPLSHTSHRYPGYDLPSLAQRSPLEPPLQSRLKWVDGVEELIRVYAGSGEVRVEVQKEAEDEERRAGR
ncbi:hypothetical protein JCM1841_001140 [Sporobolomyces salmonicolor]